MKRYFDFVVRVRVDPYGEPSALVEARKAARRTLQTMLERDGMWLASTDAGAVTVTRISAGKATR